MADLIVLYKTARDAKAFDKYYFENHIPLARKIPGLRKYRVAKGPIDAGRTLRPASDRDPEF